MVSDARRVLDAATTEDELLGLVVAYAQLQGWLVHHCRPARSEKGYRTPIQGDRGFPDLVLARERRVIFAELKTERGVLSNAQHRWINALYDLVYMWRPSDWPEIEKVLA